MHYIDFWGKSYIHFCHLFFLSKTFQMFCCTKCILLTLNILIYHLLILFSWVSVLNLLMCIGRVRRCKLQLSSLLMLPTLTIQVNMAKPFITLFMAVTYFDTFLSLLTFFNTFTSKTSILFASIIFCVTMLLSKQLLSHPLHLCLAFWLSLVA